MFLYKNFFKNLKQKNIKNYILMFPLEWILTKDKKVDNIKFAAIKDCATNYCFSDAIGNWEILQFVLSLGVSDVIITDMLGFNMERVRGVCGNTRIRATVNIAQSAWVDSTDVTKFVADKYVVNKNGNTYAVVENKVLETNDEKVIFESEEAIRNDLVLKVTEKTEDEIKKGTEKVTEAYKDNKTIVSIP